MYPVGMKQTLAILVVAILPLLAWAQGGKEPAAVDYQDPARLAALIDAGGGADAVAYYLVDVRSADEYAGGHLSTALNIPHTEIGSRPPTTDKDALVIVYCRSGARSTAAKKTLDEMGYTRVVNFGPVSRWTGELVTGVEPTAQ